MIFTEAVNEVVGITGRPDKILDIRREINAAVNMFSLDADFTQDVQEQLLAINPLLYGQNIPYSSLTRFRKMQFLKRAGTYEYLTELQAKKLTSSEDAKDRWYTAGSGIRTNMCKLASALDIGYYQYPPTLTDIAGAYWMLDISPYMVIDRTAAKIFINIGDRQSADIHLQASAQAFTVFRRSQGAT